MDLFHLHAISARWTRRRGKRPGQLAKLKRELKHFSPPACSETHGCCGAFRTLSTPACSRSSAVLPSAHPPMRNGIERVTHPCCSHKDRVIKHQVIDEQNVYSSGAISFQWRGFPLPESKREHLSSLIRENHHNPRIPFKSIDLHVNPISRFVQTLLLQRAREFCSFSLTRLLQLRLSFRIQLLTRLSTFLVPQCWIPLRQFPWPFGGRLEDRFMALLTVVCLLVYPTMFNACCRTPPA